MNYFLKFLFILSFCQISGQSIKNGVVNYRITVSKQSIEEYRKERRKNIKNKDALKFWDNFYKELNYTEGTLKFSGLESSYKLNRKLKNESQNNLTTIDIFAGNKRVYFVDFLEKLTLAQDCDLLGECYLIETDFLEWELTHTTKIIEGYRCYLAKAVINGKKKKIISAWYTKEIPTNFGPMIYSGLPGLILELDNESISFSVERIQLNLKNKINIQKKEKATSVSKEEFIKVSKKYFPKKLFKN